MSTLALESYLLYTATNLVSNKTFLLLVPTTQPNTNPPTTTTTYIIKKTMHLTTPLLSLLLLLTPLASAKCYKKGEEFGAGKAAAVTKACTALVGSYAANAMKHDKITDGNKCYDFTIKSHKKDEVKVDVATCEKWMKKQAGCKRGGHDRHDGIEYMCVSLQAFLSLSFIWICC